MTLIQKMQALARSLHSLRDADGIDPWDVFKLDAWAGPKSHGERCAVQFVLSVWNPHEARQGAYESGYFDIQEAMQVWDWQHRQAFLAWASNPWWP